LKFKAAPHYRFKIWAEGNKQKIQVFNQFLHLFDESLRSFPVWNTGAVVLMERAVFPIVILFRRINADPDYPRRLFCKFLMDVDCLKQLLFSRQCRQQERISRRLHALIQ
jgi:hypothetical protein